MMTITMTNAAAEANAAANAAHREALLAQYHIDMDDAEQIEAIIARMITDRPSYRVETAPFHVENKGHTMTQLPSAGLAIPDGFVEIVQDWSNDLPAYGGAFVREQIFLNGDLIATVTHSREVGNSCANEREVNIYGWNDEQRRWLPLNGWTCREWAEPVSGRSDGLTLIFKEEWRHPTGAAFFLAWD
jgi:hypothetical protein